MSSRTATVLVLGILLGGILVACGSKRGPDLLPASHAEPAEAAGQSPPGIKKDVKVDFTVVGKLRWEDGQYEAWPVVKEVKGHWVLLGFTPTQMWAANGWKYTELWVNFNNVTSYRTN
jgi:hypothetical protein